MAVEKVVMPNVQSKMDIASVEAMLSESGLNTKNSHILFKHLNQFFGKIFLNQKRSIENTMQVKISHLKLTGKS